MAAPGIQLLNGAVAHPDEPILDSVEPTTPLETEAPPEASQTSLAVSDVPASPTEAGQSFHSELLPEDPTGPVVIPSSLTPPPSSQAPNSNANIKRSVFGPARGSQFFSPPATVLNTLRGRADTSDYKEPTAEWIKNAPIEDLRSKLQSCIMENQKLKAEGAHHRLQLNLLNLQASNDLERAAVEHEMVRAEVDAIRSSEYFVQTKREMSAAAEAHQVRVQAIQEQCDAALEDNKVLNRRFRSAKKVIMQKEEEIQALSGERDMLLNRIRENREHFHMLCSQGGILHGALTPNKPQHAAMTPQQQARGTPRQTARQGEEGREHGLSALLQAMSQDNNSAPTTPLVSQRPAPRHLHKHNRNVQSLSSLPTTPQNKVRGGSNVGGLLPSVSLVPQTEPQRSSSRHFLPATPMTPKREQGRKSRESTISAEDNAELARQALESAGQPFFAVRKDAATDRQSYTDVRGDREEQRETYEGSRASQEARAMLRQDAGQEAGWSTGRDDGAGAKRKLDEERSEVVGGPRVPQRDSPYKKMKVGALVDGPESVGLGIQYSKQG